MQSTSSTSSSCSLWICGRAFAVLALAGLVYGCATPTPVTPVSTHPSVSINVYPSGSSTPDGWTCTTLHTHTLCASEDPIDLARDPDPVTIQWMLGSEPWKFCENRGIQVAGGGWHEREVDATKYTAWNNKDKRIYKYKICATNGSVTLEWDPFIWNN
jgi:hypothetical protein